MINSVRGKDFPAAAPGGAAGAESKQNANRVLVNPVHQSGGANMAGNVSRNQMTGTVTCSGSSSPAICLTKATMERLSLAFSMCM
jgi:hypothetical protein